MKNNINLKTNIEQQLLNSAQAASTNQFTLDLINQTNQRINDIINQVITVEVDPLKRMHKSQGRNDN